MDSDNIAIFLTRFERQSQFKLSISDAIAITFAAAIIKLNCYFI